jgi:hypothetical protein
MHMDGMALVQVLFQGLPLIHKAGLVRIMFLAQIFVAIIAVGEVRVFAQSHMDPMLWIQMLGNGAVGSPEMAIAILTKCHGWLFGFFCSRWFFDV